MTSTRTAPAPCFTVTSMAGKGCLFMASWTRRQMTDWGYLADAMNDDRCTYIEITRGNRTLVSASKSRERLAVTGPDGVSHRWSSNGPGTIAGVPRREDIFGTDGHFAEGWDWTHEATRTERAAKRAALTTAQRETLRELGVSV